MRLRRRLLLHPDPPPAGEGEGGGEEGGKGKGGEAPPASKPPSGEAPKDVPYDVFQKTNAQMREVQGQLEKANAKLAGFEGWVKPEDHKAVVSSARQRATLLADGRVEPKYRDYIAGRMDAAKPDDTGAWLTALRESEPAFFLQDGAAAPPPSKTPPSKTPEGGAGPKPPGQGRSPTAQEIEAMSVDEYKAWKDGGGLKRLTADAPA